MKPKYDLSISSFLDFINGHLVDSDGYNCCLGVSGGKDSTRQALVEGRNIERIIIMGLSRPPKEIKDNASNPFEFEFDATTKILIIKKPGVSALTDWSFVFEF